MSAANGLEHLRVLAGVELVSAPSALPRTAEGADKLPPYAGDENLPGHGLPR
jgi:hypothetical protein